MVELVHSAQNFMNAEDAIIAKKRKRAERMETDLPRHPEQGPRPKKARTGEKKDRDNKKVGSSSKGVNITLIKDDPSFKWPEKMKEDPNKHNKNKYCSFHKNHSHDTDKCYDLK